MGCSPSTRAAAPFLARPFRPLARTFLWAQLRGLAGRYSVRSVRFPSVPSVDSARSIPAA
eukprot:10867282-Alexandrium_andersonii.AAC.1